MEIGRASDICGCVRVARISPGIRWDGGVAVGGEIREELLVALDGTALIVRLGERRWQG